MRGKFHCYLAQSMLESWPISLAGSFLNKKTIFHRKAQISPLWGLQVDG